MMTPLFPRGSPPDWLRELRQRAEAFLARASAIAREVVTVLREDAGRAVGAADRAVKAAWRSAGRRVRRAGAAVRHRAAPLLARLPLGLPSTARRLKDAATAGAAAAAGRARRIGRAAAAGMRPRLRRFIAFLGAHRPSPRQMLGLAALAVLGSWVLWERCGLTGCPDVELLTSYQPEGASVLLDRNGVEFARLAPMRYAVVPLDSLPPYVAEAFVAVEDRRFWDHDGVDWVRSLGAAVADIRAGGLAQGASTIPMQLSRTLFPDRIRREEKTFRRKLLEVRMAGEIEARFSKREILELYLNHVYLGGGSYGVRAASRYWLGKDATELTLPEAALLAALPRAPSHYDPRRHPEAAKRRRDLVLTLMERQDRLSFREAQAARETALAVAEEPDRDRDGDRLGPWFVEEVRRQLGDALGERLYRDPLRIVTTLDAAMQEAAEAELATQLRRVEQGWFGRYRGPHYSASGRPDSSGTRYVQGAVVVLDARTGDVRAWVGGRDHDHSRYDRARLARRQAGSAFKPFVYAAALEDGLAASQPVLDAPYHLARGGGRTWSPDNYDGSFLGRMSMREALMRSQNVPAVRVAAAVGPERVRHVAARLGLSGEVPPSPVAALGVATATPLEMATAFAAFATLGERPEPRFVLRVEDQDGEVLWAREPARTRVMAPDVAYVLTDMLRDVVDYGTGRAVRSVGYHGPAAGKTGTTSDATDVWFVGYTPELVGAVWVGHDQVRPLPRGATGGGVAAPVWGRILARAGPDSGEWPDAPAGVVARRIDPETGLPLRDGCYPRWGEARTDLFLAGAVPAASCPRRWDQERYGWGRWWRSVFGGGDPGPAPIPGPVDPELGVPRLPVEE